MRKLSYIVGLQFGDEGKGNFVQYLCKKAIERNERTLVVRYCSGPQASHTVVNGDITHVCASFGSGVLLGIPTYIYNGTETLIDPIALKAEYEVLIDKGIKPIFYIDPMCKVITPYDVIANRKNEDSLANGTCGCGVWETINRYNQIFNCLAGYLLTVDTDFILDRVRNFYDFDSCSLDEAFREAVEFIKPFIRKLDIEQYDTVIMESSQGLLLDGIRGLKPYITPCEIFPHKDYNLNLFPDVTFNEVQVYLVTRTYTTRHGAGYTPRLIDGLIDTDCFEANKDNEFQGDFKVGLLDIDLINKGIERHCLSNYEVPFNLVVTHCDCLLTESYLRVLPFIINKNLFSVKAVNPGLKIADMLNLEFNTVFEGYSFKSEFNEV